MHRPHIRHAGWLCLMALFLAVGINLTTGHSSVSAAPATHIESSPREEATAFDQGLVVSAVGSVTYPADEAYLIVIPDYFYGPPETEQFTAQDRQALMTAVQGQGLSKKAVSFISRSRYEPVVIRVAIGMDQTAEYRQALADSIQDNLRQRIEVMGMTYALTPANCKEAAAAAARQQAVPLIQQAASDLAAAFGVQLGPVVGVREYPIASSTRRTKPDICAVQDDSHYLHSTLVDLAAASEVEVAIGLQVTYLLQHAE